MCFGIEYPNAIVTRAVVVQTLKCYVNLNFNAIFFVCGGIEINCLCPCQSRGHVVLSP